LEFLQPLHSEFDLHFGNYIGVIVQIGITDFNGEGVIEEGREQEGEG